MKSMLRVPLLGYVLLGLTLVMAGSLFAASSLYDFTMSLSTARLRRWVSTRAKLWLVVNVASRCGFYAAIHGARVHL